MLDAFRRVHLSTRQDQSHIMAYDHDVAALFRVILIEGSAIGFPESDRVHNAATRSGTATNRSASSP